MTKRKTAGGGNPLSEIMLEPARSFKPSGCQTCKLNKDALAELKKCGEMMADGTSDWTWSMLHAGMRKAYEGFKVRDYRAMKRHFKLCWPELHDGIEAKQAT